MRRSGWIVVAACVVLGAARAEATTYTVKPSGGDYATIQGCANVVTAGDTCLVYAGTYNERVTTQAGGTSEAARITFQVESGTVTMQGFTINHQYVTVEGFDITGYYVSSWVGLVTIGNNADYAQVLSNTLHDNNGTYHVRGIQFERVLGDSANYCIIRGNTITRLFSQYFLLHGNYHVIENNTMSEAGPWDAFIVNGTNHVIRRNVFWNTGTTPGINHTDWFQTFSSSGEAIEDILFEENLVYNRPAQLFQTNSSVDGTKGLVTNVKDVTVRRNILVGVPGNGNVGMPGMTFENNTFYRIGNNSGSNGVLLNGSMTRSDSSRTTLKNNVFLDCGNTPATVNGTTGFYRYTPAIMGTESLLFFVTDSTVIAAAIYANLYANGYVTQYNGGLLAPAYALTSIDDFVWTLDASYDAYKTDTYTLLVASAALATSMHDTFVADYNYVGGSPGASYPAKASSSCADPPVTGYFCETHGVNGGDPELQAGSALTTSILSLAPLTNGAWTASTKTLVKAGAFTSYTPVDGDSLWLVSAENASLGYTTELLGRYPVSSKTDSDTLVFGDLIEGKGMSDDRANVNAWGHVPQSVIVGADGVPFTIDDGLKPSATGTYKRLCGAGEGGVDIGAYSCTAGVVFSGKFNPPTNPVVREP